jgi:hypothetical protein
MKHKTVGCTQLCPLSFGSLVSYELCGDHIIVKLLGLVQIKSINVAAVSYLRLAVRAEVSPFYYLFHWPKIMKRGRYLRPVYVLQTRKRHRIFLRLDGDAHFRLRQAIARHSDSKKHRKAA